jgi:hypothetical protein
MPIKLFQDGDILTHTDVNTYFMDQALVVFDDAAQRDNAFDGALEPGLLEGRICYLKSDDKIYIYTGAGWTPQLALIEDGVVTTSKLDGTGGSEAVTEAKIRTGAVTENKIGTGAVTSAKLGSNLSLTGTTKIEEIFEKASVVSAQPVSTNGGTLTLTITDGSVYYYTTSTTRNVVLDIVTTGMITQQAVTVMVAITSGSTAGKISEIKVNGVTNTAKWFGGNLNPNGSGGGAVDAYTITVFRNVDDYTVFASQSKFA